MIENLESELIPHLKEAKEIHIAVALMNSYGLDTIEETIPEDCLRKYLVGIHLPTPPNILQRLMESESRNSAKISSKVHVSHSNYHPKVYVIRKKDDQLIAFIGSANATRGGFKSNIEMTTSIEDQKRCKHLLSWFGKLFEQSSSLSQNFIDGYKTRYIRNKQLESAQRSNNEHFYQEHSEQANSTFVSETQFFTQSDFDAFAPSTHFETDGPFVDARGQVRRKMINLHYAIFPQFVDYGMMNIYPARRKQDYTSKHYHSQGIFNAKESIWFNYGKDRQGFTNHLRIQIILMNSERDQYVGFWIFCKPNSSIEDRQRLQTGLSNHIFLDRLYKGLLSLGDFSWIAIGDDDRWISDIKDKEDLIEFLRSDDFSQEFLIGRNYHPNHPDISAENIYETTLIQFSKLYKIYSLMTENVN